MAAGLGLLEEQTADLAGAVEEACGRIAPLWPLKSFVAVNPFLGLSGMPFAVAGRLLDRVSAGGLLMDTGYYLGKLREGAIEPADILAALERCEGSGKLRAPVAWLEEQLQLTSRTDRVLSVADALDEMRGTNWAGFVVDEVSKWCSSYFDAGQSAWRMPWRDLPLYQAWKQAAALDANPEAAGLAGFRRYVWELPDEEEASIAASMARLAVPGERAADFLHRQLLSVAGWSAYAAYQDRQGLGDNTVRQVLAIRLAYDAALLALDETWRCGVRRSRADAGFTEAKYVAHLALEHAFRRKLTGKLRAADRPSTAGSRKALQAVFCIDVRSEVYRRALEAQSPQIATAGFAGFFGMSLEVGGTARCPVLLSPGYKVTAEHPDSPFTKAGRGVAGVWKQLTQSASACFSAVEVGGAWFATRLLREFGSGSGAAAPAEEQLRWRIPLGERVALAAGALKNMSLEASKLAPVVLLCGHGSATANNPYAASLDCGACGGHKGDVNARFAAALLNDAEVRQALAVRGMRIPADTVFVAALHNTTTDEVRLYESDRTLPARQRAEIEGWLRAASQAARRERASVDGDFDWDIQQEAQRRSTDWSEVRPEWGLAGNAAFIAAPRWRTQALPLEGRAFLHEYDAAADEDGSVLQLILTAPVIVASWINLQYFGSTVNNKLFGSGNKVLHNVVGKFGVWEGNGGDLRTGLPLQSLHDGERWRHEPLRLQVYVEAPRERVDRILRGHVDIRNLVENNWIYLLAMEGDRIYECAGAGKWRSVDELDLP